MSPFTCENAGRKTNYEFAGTAVAAAQAVSHTWLDRGGAGGDLMELNGWTSTQMPRRYGASAREGHAVSIERYFLRH